MRRLAKNLAYAILFPFFSLFSKRVGLCVFIPMPSGWFAATRGRVFPVVEPRLWVLEYFRHFVPRNGGLVFDVGGEKGYETAQFSYLVGKNGRVIVFECFPEHIEKLQALAGRMGNITVVDRACWDVNTKLEFFVGNTPGSNTAVANAKGQRGQSLADPSKQVLVVQAECLDDAWKRLTNCASIDFLKMDIEGAEYEALDGAEEMLRATERAVIAAYHMRDGVPTAARVEFKLQQLGFFVRTDENLHVYAWR